MWFSTDSQTSKWARSSAYFGESTAHMTNPHVALNCFINCPLSGSLFENSAPQLSFSGIIGWSGRQLSFPGRVLATPKKCKDPKELKERLIAWSLKVAECEHQFKND